MSKRRGEKGSPSAERRQPATSHEEPEEGEVSDDPGPSTANHDKAYSDASDSPKGFAKIPLPFKSRGKADPRPLPEPRTRVPGSYDRPSGHGVYPLPNAYDRWPPDERDRDHHDYRGTHSSYYGYDYRDARYDQSSRYGGADSYIPNYESNERPTPSPPRRRRDDLYRPGFEHLPPRPRSPSELPPPPPPPPPPAPPPLQNGAPDFVNGVPPPTTDEPPPVVPATQQPEPPKGEPLSKRVPIIKAAGTKFMRPPEAELEAYGRTFTGVDRLSDFELLNKLGEGTFGQVISLLYSLP